MRKDHTGFCYGKRIEAPSASEKSCPTFRNKMSILYVAAFRALGRSSLSFRKKLCKLQVDAFWVLGRSFLSFFFLERKMLSNFRKEVSWASKNGFQASGKEPSNPSVWVKPSKRLLEAGALQSCQKTSPRFREKLPKLSGEKLSIFPEMKLSKLS